MSILTLSQFYYGHTITDSNSSIDFSEGGPELQAELEIGDYSLSEFVTAIESALNAVGALTYTVTLNRTTRVITIAASGAFELLTNSGTRLGTSAYVLMGFSTAADHTGASSYASESGSGYSFRPQKILYDYSDQSYSKEKNQATVNESASGIVQVLEFGTQSFFDFSIRYQTNIFQGYGSFIENNATGVEDVIAFMDYAITKAKMEFMPDRDTTSTFYKVLLEKTGKSSKGTGYELDPVKGVIGYFNSEKMRLRVVTT